MKFYKIKSLFKLGIEDLLKNMNVLIYIILPVLFALLYSNMGELSKDFAFSLCILLMLSMVPVALMGTIIAEEKEKNTLRTLMLNDVSATQILFAKALICMLFVVIDSLLIFFLMDISFSYFLVYQGVSIFVGLAVILFGAVVGLLAKNQMSAGLLSMPFMVILMAPLFVSFFDNKIANSISACLPTDAMMTIILNVSSNTANFSNTILPLLVIFFWLILSIILFKIAYQKVGIDN